MTASLIEIRPASDEDAADLALAHEQAWRLAYTGIIPFPQLDRMIARRGPVWWRFALKHGAGLLVVDFNGQIAGYANFGATRRTWRNFRNEIFELYLKPEFQGVGLGTRLFQATRTEIKARRPGGCVVWALAENEAACRFYRRLGGKDVARANESFGGHALEKIAFGWAN